MQDWKVRWTELDMIEVNNQADKFEFNYVCRRFFMNKMIKVKITLDLKGKNILQKLIRRSEIQLFV